MEKCIENVADLFYYGDTPKKWGKSFAWANADLAFEIAYEFLENGEDELHRVLISLASGQYLVFVEGEVEELTARLGDLEEAGAIERREYSDWLFNDPIFEQRTIEGRTIDVVIPRDDAAAVFLKMTFF